MRTRTFRFDVIATVALIGRTIKFGYWDCPLRRRSRHVSSRRIGRFGEIFLQSIARGQLTLLPTPRPVLPTTNRFLPRSLRARNDTPTLFFSVWRTEIIVRIFIRRFLGERKIIKKFYSLHEKVKKKKNKKKTRPYRRRTITLFFFTERGFVLRTGRPFDEMNDFTKWKWHIHIISGCRLRV